MIEMTIETKQIKVSERDFKFESIESEDVLYGYFIFNNVTVSIREVLNTLSIEQQKKLINRIRLDELEKAGE